MSSISFPRIKLRPPSIAKRVAEWRKKQPDCVKELSKEKDRIRKRNIRENLKNDINNGSREARMRAKHVKDYMKEYMRVRRSKKRQAESENDKVIDLATDQVIENEIENDQVIANEPVKPNNQVIENKVTNQEKEVIKPFSRFGTKLDRTIYYRNKKREQREKRSRQMVSSSKRKDAQRKRVVRGSSTASTSSSETSNQVKKPIHKSTVRRKANEVQDILPKSPTNAKRVLRSVNRRLGFQPSPMQKKMISRLESRAEKVEKVATDAVKAIIKDLKNDRTRNATAARKKFFSAINLSLRKNKINSSHVKALGVTRQAISRYKDRQTSFEMVRRKKRVDSLSNESKAIIQKYFLESEFSRTVPSKKGVKNNEPIVVLDVTIRFLYSQFIEAFPNINCCLSTFSNLRPTNVKQSDPSKDFISCECPYCTNIELKLIRIKKMCQKNTIPCPVQNKYEFVEAVLCKKDPNSKFHDLECIQGKCKQCCFSTKIPSIFATVPSDAETKWQRWEPAVVSYQNKEGETIEKVKRCLIEKNGTINVLIHELCQDFKVIPGGITFATHCFEARWQYLQGKYLKENLPHNSILSILDFGQNYSIKYKNEIKSASYSKAQITLHPIVVYYHSSGKLVREELVFLSDDLSHDTYAVSEFTRMMHVHLREIRKIEFTNEYRFSDGCSCQYKGKKAFFDDAQEPPGAKDLDIVFNFFGSEHGKSESDGVTGVVKSGIDRGILANNVIKDARDVFNYCQKNLQAPASDKSFRSFFLVNTVPRDETRYESCITIPGTRRLHSARRGPIKDASLQIRKLSCFCRHCLTENYDQCQNKKVVGEWQDRNVIKRSDMPIIEAEAMDIVELAPEAMDIVELAPEAATDISDDERSEVDFSIEDINCSKGDWVIVNFYTTKYPGIVKAVDGQGVKVSVMEKIGLYWKWPKPVDCIYYERKEIMARTEGPVHVKRGQFFFKEFSLDS